MKKIIYILVLCFAFVSCGSPQKVTTNIQTKEQTTEDKNLLENEDTRWSETITRAIRQEVAERLNIRIKQNTYDTDKPADPLTGKHPLKESKDISLTKDTDTKIADNTILETDSTTIRQIVDKGTIKVKNNRIEQTKTEKGLQTWQKVLIAVGVLAILSVIIKLYLKFKV